MDARLNDEEIAALHAALDDEYQAFTTYGQVIADFGEVQPFIHIRDAEARHIEALRAAFERHGLPIPANPWPGKVPRFASLLAACEAAVAGELANAALYRRLLASTSRADLTAVFLALRDASQQRHLPAFRRCVERDAEGGDGRGQRHRHRHGQP